MNPTNDDVDVRYGGRERTMTHAELAAMPQEERERVEVWQADAGWVRPARFADTGDSFSVVGHDDDAPDSEA